MHIHSSGKMKCKCWMYGWATAIPEGTRILWYLCVCWGTRATNIAFYVTLIYLPILQYVHVILLQILENLGDPIIPPTLRFILSKELICIIVVFYWYPFTILGNRDIYAPHESSWPKYTPGTCVSVRTMKHPHSHYLRIFKICRYIIY